MSSIVRPHSNRLLKSTAAQRRAGLGRRLVRTPDVLLICNPAFMRRAVPGCQTTKRRYRRARTVRAPFNQFVLPESYREDLRRERRDFEEPASRDPRENSTPTLGAKINLVDGVRLKSHCEAWILSSGFPTILTGDSQHFRDRPDQIQSFLSVSAGRMLASPNARRSSTHSARTGRKWRLYDSRHSFRCASLRANVLLAGPAIAAASRVRGDVQRCQVLQVRPHRPYC